MQAMIFAAGLGTRLKPLTDQMPKALVPIQGKPLLEHLLLKLQTQGFDKVVINVHHMAEQIIDFLENHHFEDMEIFISDESGELLETGGGIRKAWRLFDESRPVLIHNVDIISNMDLAMIYNHHCKMKNDATLVVSSRDTFRYFLFNEEGFLRAWINEKTGQTKPAGVFKNPSEEPSGIRTSKTDLRKLAFAGIHVISGSLIKAMNSYPDKFPITDFYLDQLNDFRIGSYVPEHLRMMDVGKIDQLPLAEEFFSSLKSD